MRNRKFRPSAESLEGRQLLSTAPQYTVTDVGEFGSIPPVLNRMNDLGQITGFNIFSIQNGSDINAVVHAVLSDPNGGTFHDIGALPGGIFSNGEDVNNLGQVTGISSLAPDSPDSLGHAFLSEPNGGTLHDLGVLFPGDRGSEGLSVNNSGQVTGVSYGTRTSATYFAFISDPNGGQLHSLGTLPGDKGSAGYSINSFGQVAGTSEIPDGNTYKIHAFFSDPNGGSLHDIGGLPGFYNNFAISINDSGQICGSSSSRPQIGVISLTHAFYYNTNSGIMTDLGVPSGWYSSAANEINNSGEIVGAIYNLDHSIEHPFLYTSGTMYDLNSLIPNELGLTLTADYESINNSGQILVTGSTSDGRKHAFLLTRTPTTPTISWANPTDITYGTPLSATQLNATADVPGTFTYDVAAGTVLHAGAAQVIHATFTPDDLVHYTTATAEVSINVLKAPLTVTANYLTRASWQVNPPLTGTITGLVNGDTDVATYTTTATNSSPVGDYPIVPHLTDSNYNITFVNGNLTITQTANTGVSFVNGTINIAGFLASGNVADVSIDPANQKIKVVFNWFVIEYDPAIVTKIIYNGSPGGHDIYNNHTTIESVATGFGGGNTFSSNSDVSTWSMYGSGNSIHSDHGVNWLSRHSYSVLEIGTGTFYDVV